MTYPVKYGSRQNQLPFIHLLWLYTCAVHDITLVPFYSFTLWPALFIFVVSELILIYLHFFGIKVTCLSAD